MTLVTILELVAGVLLVGFAGHLYRRRSAANGSRGSQSAVILLVIGILLLVHGAGLMEYRPSQAEIEAQAAPRQFP
jgi:hypothetical protein